MTVRKPWVGGSRVAWSDSIADSRALTGQTVYVDAQCSWPEAGESEAV
jgi:hypothetical protein